HLWSEWRCWGRSHCPRSRGMVERSGSTSGDEQQLHLHEFRRRDFVAVGFRAQRCVSVAIGNCKSKIENLLAGVVQWQNGSFPSCTRGFDSPHPLPPSLEAQRKTKVGASAVVLREGGLMCYEATAGRPAF